MSNVSIQKDGPVWTFAKLHEFKYTQCIWIRTKQLQKSMLKSNLFQYSYPNMIFFFFNYGDIKALDFYLHCMDEGESGTVYICCGYINL